MFDYDVWQEIFNTIRKHKLRTFLTALGVFWGIFMLVFLMGSGAGLENGVMSSFGNHAKNSLFVWTQSTSLPYNGLRAGRRARLTMDDVVALQTQFADKIAYIAPRMGVPANAIRHGDKSATFEVRGEVPDYIHIAAMELKTGRFINPLDMKEKRKIAVIGKRVAEVLLAGEKDPVGQNITFNGNDFMVVGVFSSNRKAGDGDEEDQSVFIPLTTAQQITNQPNRIGWFVCSMHDHVKVSSIEEEVKTVLKNRHQIAPEDKQGVRSFNLEEEFGQIQGLFKGINLIIWVVGIGSLLAGIIGVGNIMLIVVKERTREIGIRKALGATPASIVSMVLLESVFITTMAGYLGLLVSTGLIVLMNLAAGTGSEFFASPQVKFDLGLSALAILVVCGTLTGLIPALQAARINPVVALRDE